MSRAPTIATYVLLKVVHNPVKKSSTEIEVTAAGRIEMVDGVESVDEIQLTREQAEKYLQPERTTQ